MIITKMALPRRTFLRGMGATVALPLLEAMVPAATPLAETPAHPARRFGAVYIPNGAIMEQWIPRSEGRDFEFTPILQPLAPFRSQLVVVNNLSRAGGDSVTDHAVASAGWLSGAVAKRTEAEDVRVGPTIDQIIAKQIGQTTPFPSLELATEDFTGFVGGCVPGYSCAYMNTLSWASATTPLPMEINPRVVFERLFGRPGTQAQRLSYMKEDRSILDSITADAHQLERGLGVRDRARLGEYLDDIREIERRIQRTEVQNGKEITVLDAPMGIPDFFEAHAALMFDLLAVAYEADLTRVFTFMMAREASMRTYPEIGVDAPHHTISHHQNKPDQIALHAKVNLFFMQQFAKFVSKLQTTPDGDGSLLDHSLLFYGAGMSNGNAHSPHPLPLIVLGNGPDIKGGRHLAVRERTPIANLWLGVADGFFNCSLESFGESTGRVEL
jgi:Protein of unknown function (DUF1552)